MAKALPGFAVGPDPRAVQRLAIENRRLSQRVAELEDLVLRLQLENDGLAKIGADIDSEIDADAFAPA